MRHSSGVSSIEVNTPRVGNLRVMNQMNGHEIGGHDSDFAPQIDKVIRRYEFPRHTLVSV